jgi:cystathionine beta-lyase/cystathionine gamma-synthase
MSTSREFIKGSSPTRKALEMSCGSKGVGFFRLNSCGNSHARMFGPGDLIVHDDLYGGTYRLLVNVTQRHGVDVEFVNLREPDLLRKAIRSSTKAVWTETPTNPLMNILDLGAIADIVHEHKIVTICDNPFLSPYFQRPLELGIDVVVHSTTKYINGHSDVVGGGHSQRRSIG